MKKSIVVSLIFLGIFILTGCVNNEKQGEQSNNKFMQVEANDKGKIVINTEDITSDATFVNYETGDVMIQFVVVRGTDGEVRIAFNTCEACNPSPNAYFIQKGEYLECQNCGNKFHIDKIGIEKGGCNPALVKEKSQTDTQIIIDADYVDTYKSRFANWNGPTE